MKRSTFPRVWPCDVSTAMHLTVTVDRFDCFSAVLTQGHEFAEVLVQESTHCASTSGSGLGESPMDAP